MKVRVSLVLFFSFVSALSSFGDGSSQVFHGQFGDARIRRSDGSSAQVFYDQFGNAKIRLSDGSSAQVVCDQFDNAKMRNSDGSSAQIVHDQFGNARMRNSDGSSAQISHDQFGNAQIVHDQFGVPSRCNSGGVSPSYGYRSGASSVQSISLDRQSSTSYEPGDAYDTDQLSLIHSGASDPQLIREQNAMRMMVERMPIRSSTTPQIDGYRRIGADGQGGGCSFGDALGNIAVDVAVQELCRAFCDERNEGRTTRRSSVGGCSSDSDARFFVVFLIVVAVVIGIIVGILWLVVQLIRKLFSMFLNGILCFWRLEVSKVLLFMCIFLYMVNIYAWCVDFGLLQVFSGNAPLLSRI